MSTRVYPLFQKGNPQLRIFLPNFWMKIVRPKEPIPPYMVTFQTSIEMTEHDVKNYLEKIYNIPVIEVKLTIKQGLIRRAYGETYLVKEDDYKEALVTMPRNRRFIYPHFIDISKSSTSNRLSDMKKMSAQYAQTGQSHLPQWFT